MTGWWFGTWRLWLSIYWEFHHPNWRTHIFQRDSNHQPAMIVIHGRLVTCILVVLFVIVLEVRRKNVILTVTRDSYGLMDLGNVATYSLKQIDTYLPQSRSNMIKLFYGIFWYSLVYTSIYKATKIMFRGPILYERHRAGGEKIPIWVVSAVAEGVQDRATATHRLWVHGQGWGECSKSRNVMPFNPGWLRTGSWIIIIYIYIHIL